MSIQSFLLPVFVQIALTFGVLFRLGFLRVRAAKTGGASSRDIAFGRAVWPDLVIQVERSYANQFELPILFYVLLTLEIVTRQGDFLFVVLEWTFVILRLVHAGIHITSNRLLPRFQTFVAGAIILMVMWLIFAVRILTAL